MKLDLRAVKRLIRPLIPDPVIARLRPPPQSRHNVVMLVATRQEQRRWAALTPDTYQVAIAPTADKAHPYSVANVDNPQPGMADIVVAGDARMVDRYGPQSVTALTTHALDAVLVAWVPRPAKNWRVPAEPQVAPKLVATWGLVWREVGGWPDGQPGIPIFADRIRAAGRRMGLIPLAGDSQPAGRSDPINRPAVVIFGAVPLHDVGGGSRGAQIGFELLRRGYHVICVNAFESTESVDLGLRYLHPQLEQLSLAEFDSDVVAARAAAGPRVAVVEIPLGELIAPLERLSAAGFDVVYDLIDYWSATSLGGDWYRSDDEQALARSASALVATAPDLVQRLQAISQREVTLIPNGVSETMFSAEAGQVPADFPPGDGPVIGFHGSLYGDWFDWQSLARVAGDFSSARVLVIGDDRGHPRLPANVHFLGLKPQSELLSYVGRFDVAIIPFVVSEVTHAVSPLKVYEYLAAGVPVAAPPLRPLAGLEGVFTSTDLSEAVRLAMWAPRPDRRAALAAHSWGNRVRQLFAAVGLELAPVTDCEVVVKLRPPIHHPKSRRTI